MQQNTHDSQRTALILFILGLLLFIAYLYTQTSVMLSGTIICACGIVLIGFANMLRAMFRPRPRAKQQLPAQERVR